MVSGRSASLLLCTAASLALACASAPAPRKAAPAPESQALGARADVVIAAPPGAESVGLSFAVEPAEAEVLIDGRSLGTVGALARSGVVPLQAGLYQVSLRCPGYATWRAEVAVRSGIEPIRVTLTRKP